MREEHDILDVGAGAGRRGERAGVPHDAGRGSLRPLNPDVRQGFVAGGGLIVAVMSAIAAWYMTAGAGEWLLGGLLAGLAAAAAILAIIILLRSQLAPASLADSNLLFTALDMSLNGRVITDAAGNLLYANQAYRQLVDATRGAVPSPVDICRNDPAARKSMERLLKIANYGGQGQETVQLDLPGGRRWLRFVAGEAAHPGAKVVWQIIDVTNRDALWQMVALSRDTLSRICDGLGRGLLILDGAGELRGINRVLLERLGHQDSAALMDRPGREVLPAFDEAGACDLVSFAGRINEGERTLRLATRDGGEIAMTVIAAEHRRMPEIGAEFLILILGDAEAAESAGQTRSAAAVPAPAAVSAADARFERYFADAPLAIATVDEAGRIYETNRLFQNLFAAFPAPGDHNLSEVIAESDLAEILGRINAVLAGDIQAAPMDVRLRKGDAQAQLYVHRVESGDGAAPRAMLYLIDVTDQKNLEMQFAQSQKMQAVGQLAGGIAHDFNNLLTAITGFCDLLLVRHGPGDQSFADVMQIKQNANRAANLVRQLLAFSRQQTLRPKVLIVTDVLAELSNLLRRLIGENIELQMHHGRNLGPVRVDQGQLEQVIINLAVNARDAMPNGGVLTIRTANVSTEEARSLGHTVMPPAEYVLIEVSDTGVGIPKENLGKIFEPFFSTKEVGKGTGLGLSTVYGIVKQTGGFIFPESEVGKGATFRIYLPLHENAAPATGPAATAAPERPRDLTGKGTILLVEDEDAVRLFASRALKNKGYNVLEASSGEQALDIVDERGEEIDVLISDVVMPNMDGPSLVKAIQERHRDLKIIFISGYAEDAFRKNLGPTEVSFLPKPFSLKQLAETVKEVLEG